MSRLPENQTMLTLEVPRKLNTILKSIADIEGISKSQLARSVLHDFAVKYNSRRALVNKDHCGGILDLRRSRRDEPR